jgi:hypothetical protein
VVVALAGHPNHQEPDHCSVLDPWDRRLSQIEGELQPDCAVSAKKCTLCNKRALYAMNMQFMHNMQNMQICKYCVYCICDTYMHLGLYWSYDSHIMHLYDERRSDPQLPTRDRDLTGCIFFAKI